jgi:uncharacterized protein (DUF2336 family)
LSSTEFSVEPNAKRKMNTKALSLIFELDAAVSKASDSWRSELLRRVADLLVGSADSYSDHQIAIFGDIMGRLIENVEVSALIDLSSRLAPLNHAPVNVIARLARNDSQEIAGPVLELSSVLSDDTLIDIAMEKWPPHLVAIAGRSWLTEPVTEVLINRGNPEAMLKLIANHGAKISERGFVKLIGQAKADKTLAAAMATRKDMPPELAPFLKLTLA